MAKEDDMKNIVLATVAMILGLSAVNSASAQTMDYEVLLSPLGLERAVRVNGEPCLMTTPYDLWARCGTDRVVPLGCRTGSSGRSRTETSCATAHSGRPQPQSTSAAK